MVAANPASGHGWIGGPRLLKEDPATRHIPIIALTAFAMKRDEEKMLAAGCDGYIAKPIRCKEFLATAASFLGSE